MLIVQGLSNGDHGGIGALPAFVHLQRFDEVFGIPPNNGGNTASARSVRTVAGCAFLGEMTAEGKQAIGGAFTCGQKEHASGQGNLRKAACHVFLLRIVHFGATLAAAVLGPKVTSCVSWMLTGHAAILCQAPLGAPYARMEKQSHLYSPEAGAGGLPERNLGSLSRSLRIPFTSDWVAAFGL